MTVAVIVITAVLWIAYDVWTVWYHGDEAGTSISWTIWVLSHKYPAIPFAAGLLCGHLFLGMDNPVIKAMYRLLAP